MYIIPTCYTLRHARGYGRSALRNWLLQGSKDGTTWTTLVTHVDDTSLHEPGSTASWPITLPAGCENETQGEIDDKIQISWRSEEDEDFLFQLIKIFLRKRSCQVFGKPYMFTFYEG